MKRGESRVEHVTRVRDRLIKAFDEVIAMPAGEYPADQSDVRRRFTGAIHEAQRLVGFEGETIAGWTVLRRVGTCDDSSTWECRHTCGAVKVLSRQYLRCLVLRGSKHCDACNPGRKPKAPELRRVRVGAVIGVHRVLECLVDGNHRDKRVWRTQCTTCGELHEMPEKSFRASTTATSCRKCFGRVHGAKMGRGARTRQAEKGPEL